MLPKISVIVCSRQMPSWNKHEKNVAKTIGCPYEYIRIDNSGHAYGICAAYNAGVLKSNGDILVFVHEDVFFMDTGWGKRLVKKFSQDPEIGLIGLAGTQYLTEHSPAWLAAGDPYLKGRIVHETNGGEEYYLTVFSRCRDDTEVVAVDGLFFAIPRYLFQDVQFDDSTFDGFHFYDLDICMQLRKTHKLMVTWDITVKHLSAGNCDENWKEAGKKFLEKYKNELPVRCVGQLPQAPGKTYGTVHNLKGVVSQITII